MSALWQSQQGRIAALYLPLVTILLDCKLQLFRDIYASEGESAELTFPFPLLKAATRQEFTSPAEGWQVDNVYDDMLSNGEAHIREYSCMFLRSLKLAKPRLYDPACSTGIFLSTLKSVLPDAYTVGQDPVSYTHLTLPTMRRV